MSVLKGPVTRRQQQRGNCFLTHQRLIPLGQQLASSVKSAPNVREFNSIRCSCSSELYELTPTLKCADVVERETCIGTERWSKGIASSTNQTMSSSKVLSLVVPSAVQVPSSSRRQMALVSQAPRPALFLPCVSSFSPFHHGILVGPAVVSVRS